MSSGCQESCCTSTDLVEEHVESQLMCSSFKGPPMNPESNGASSEGHRGAEMETNRCSAEEILDMSPSREEGWPEGGAAARGDSDSDDMEKNLLRSERSSPSSDDGFVRVEEFHNSKLRDLRSRLQECEKKKKEYAERLSASEELRRDLKEKLADAQAKIQDLEDSLRAKDCKLDGKRRKIMQLNGHLRVYEYEFNYLNERARVAEARVSNAESGYMTIRQIVYQNQLGLTNLNSSDARLSSQGRHADRRTGNEALHDTHDREVLTSPWSNRQPRPESSQRGSDRDACTIEPPRPGYCRLEPDGVTTGPIVSRAENEETRHDDNDETLVVDPMSVVDYCSLGISLRYDGQSFSSRGKTIFDEIEGQIARKNGIPE